ncbi:MAG: GNAT family N-acetyltransferase [Chloroflexi bacterium]|nr:GNAT family N-acetyltransferase [Chloroflexota bacterium]
MSETFEMITVNADNVDKQGFFCYMSKRKTPGYRQKRDWLAARFAEGLKLHMIHEIGGRTVGFIEYIPGEYAWRAVQAPDYLLIHCLWVVGKGKGKGYGAHLIQTCLDDARAQGKHGVVTVATERVWMAKKDIFLKHGFVDVAQAPPSFHLLVYRFDDAAPLPAFPTDWEARQARFGAGLTVIRTPQCPYVEDATNIALEFAAEKGIPSQVVTFQSAQELQANSPSPYGVFGIVLDGRLLTYHYLQRKDFNASATLTGPHIKEQE